MKATWKTAILALALLLCAATSPAWATDVDYDEVDAAASGMMAQTDQIQRAQQLFKLYRQLLIFDSEQYAGSYNLDMLEVSVTAAAAVITLDQDPPIEDFGFVYAVIASIAARTIGYQEGSEKLAALAAFNSFLYVDQVKVEDTVDEAADAVALCFGGLTSGLLTTGSLLLTGVGLAVGALTPVGHALLVAATAITIAWCVLCFTIGIYTFWQAWHWWPYY